jgi:hypothetical protein
MSSNAEFKGKLLNSDGFKGTTLNVEMGIDVLHDDIKKEVFFGIYKMEDLKGIGITLDKEEFLRLAKIVKSVARKWE